MTYSAREIAIRAEIESMAPDLNLKYMTELEGPALGFNIPFALKLVYASFDFGSGPKGFYALAQSPDDIDLAAAQLVACARHWRARHYKPPPPSDITNWAAP